MLDKLLLVKDTQSHLDKFAVVNSTMDHAVTVDMLLSVFDYERCEALSKALMAEIKRRKALERDARTRVNAVRKKVGKNAN